jgi:hypothetical protein
MYFVEARTLPRIDAFFATRRSRFVLFLDRRPQPLEIASEERSMSFPVDVALPKRDDPWGVMTWQKGSGPLAVFVIRSKQRAYQRLRRVAMQTNGILTRFPVRNIPASQQQAMQVPAVAASYLTHALENGTFATWAKRRAVSRNGLSVIVGRHHNAQQSDTVYVVVRMTEEGKRFKVVLGWENIEDTGGHANTQGVRN